MSMTKNVFLNLYYQWKLNWERFQWILTSKIDFESQILAFFNTFPLHQFSKFNNFLWVLMLILRQKSFWFYTPRLKTLQPILPYVDSLGKINSNYYRVSRSANSMWGVIFMMQHKFTLREHLAMILSINEHSSMKSISLLLMRLIPPLFGPTEIIHKLVSRFDFYDIFF